MINLENIIPDRLIIDFNRIHDNFEKGLISEDLFCQSLDLLEKGGKRATLGEVREFGGVKYMKTATGWKPVKDGSSSKGGKTEGSGDSKDNDSHHKHSKSYLEDSGHKPTDKFSLTDFAKHHNLSREHAATFIQNLEDDDVMSDIAQGKYDSFDQEDESQFNDSYEDMIEDME